MFRFKDLTVLEKSLICNGCGGKGSWLNPPNFIFEEDCDHHDFHYWRGGTKSDKKKSDRSYYRRMRKNIKTKPFLRRPLLHVAALTYYTTVVVGGNNYFHYTDEMRTKKDIK